MDLFKDKWTPMLLSEENKPFDSSEYLFEVKYDGIRAIIMIDKNVKIISRNNTDLTEKFPELQSIGNNTNKRVIFDGEIIALDNGKISFPKVLSRLHGKGGDNIVFMCFDILFEDIPLIDLELYKRKKILNKYKDSNVFVKSSVIDTQGTKLFESVKSLDLEGIVAKRKISKYIPNERSKEWIKIKNYKYDYFYVNGYKNNQNNTITVSLVDSKNNHVGSSVVSNKHYLYESIVNKNNKKIKCLVKYMGKFKKNLRDPKIM